ncbi:Engulfment/cell motility, partial [Dimargaris cristalligena]
WQALGFQSRADPTTDFRGMGQLGLDALVYYTQHHSDSAQLVLKCSRDHPTAWYSFAIVGINLAALAWRLYQSPEFQYYVYTTSLPIETVYFEFFSYLFHMFNDFWFTPQEL